MPWVGLHCVSVVFPDDTHLCFRESRQVADPALRARLLLDFSLTVKVAPHECVIRTGQP